ncbi:unnamed protein product [Miscanthus lutarioriparius]|uniref:Uncharacterized protein n=1 Tax=Miscanthus lutarioriparius TaxID=422564 RepID=A0A811N9G0_9POAL|nr:unnamed protein product [Miscanthus lutarioriparius]
MPRSAGPSPGSCCSASAPILPLQLSWASASCTSTPTAPRNSLTPSWASFTSSLAVAADAHLCGRGGVADAHPHGRAEVGDWHLPQQPCADVLSQMRPRGWPSKLMLPLSPDASPQASLSPNWVGVPMRLGKDNSPVATCNPKLSKECNLTDFNGNGI